MIAMQDTLARCPEHSPPGWLESFTAGIFLTKLTLYMHLESKGLL